MTYKFVVSTQEDMAIALISGIVRCINEGEFYFDACCLENGKINEEDFEYSLSYCAIMLDDKSVDPLRLDEIIAQSDLDFGMVWSIKEYSSFIQALEKTATEMKVSIKIDRDDNKFISEKDSNAHSIYFSTNGTEIDCAKMLERIAELTNFN